MKTYKDGSKFTGRFRFGRRDGQGVLINANGVQSKGTFRDSHMVHEKPPPEVFEGDMANFETSVKTLILQPPTLSEICFKSIAKSLNPNNKKKIYTSTFIARRVADHLKPIICDYLLSSLKNISPQYQIVANSIAFKLLEEISLDRVKMKLEDMDTFIYLSGANTILKRLRICTGKLEPTAVVVLGRHLMTRCWPVLESIDISFNSLEYRGLSNLLEGVASIPTITKLKLSGCKIDPQLSVIVANLLKKNDCITDLDVSFNMIGDKGAEAIGRSLETNKGLVKLNLRSNDLGYIGMLSYSAGCINNFISLCLFMLCKIMCINKWNPQFWQLCYDFVHTDCNVVGGMAIVNGMTRNFRLQVVVLADNKVGDDVITLLAGRLRGTLSELCGSLLTSM